MRHALPYRRSVLDPPLHHLARKTGVSVVERIGEVATDTQPVYVMGDHLGSASMTFTTNGTQVASMRYLPFGEERWDAVDMPSDRGFTNQRSGNYKALQSTCSAAGSLRTAAVRRNQIAEGEATGTIHCHGPSFLPTQLQLRQLQLRLYPNLPQFPIPNSESLIPQSPILLVIGGGHTFECNLTPRRVRLQLGRTKVFSGGCILPEKPFI